jgi:methylmalonyl-CoA decarboxylase
MNYVSVDLSDGIGTITLDDPPTRNALSENMTTGIVAAIDSLVAQHARVVVLSGGGADVWSSGHDVNELPHGRRDPLTYNDPLERCLRAVRSVNVPVIAMVHGSVWGGAVDLVLSCDIVIADETATFAITPANLGLPYNTTGLLHFLGRVPLNVVKEMFFTATPVPAEQAERWLLVNHLVPAAELEPKTREIATTIAVKAPLAIGTVKEQLRVLNDYQPISAQVYERIQGLRREAYDSEDYVEGLTAFKEKRAPVFRGR